MVWDDGDDTLAEPRAPYPHAREVAMLRAHQTALRGAHRRLRPHRRGAGAGAQRLGARPGGRPAGGAGPRPAGGGARRQRLRRGARPGRAYRAAAVDGAACRAGGAAGAAAGAGAGAAARVRARAGLRPVPHASPGAGTAPGPLSLHDRDRYGGGVPVVRPRRHRAAVRALRIGCGARRGRRRPPHRRGTRPGVPRHHGDHLRRRRDGAARSAHARRWWSPPRAPNRRRRAATARRCCWTAGRCWAGRTCGRPRTRCGDGWPPRRWCGPAPTAAWWPWSPSRPSRRCRR